MSSLGVSKADSSGSIQPENLPELLRDLLYSYRYADGSHAHRRRDPVEDLILLSKRATVATSILVTSIAPLARRLVIGGLK